MFIIVCCLANIILYLYYISRRVGQREYGFSVVQLWAVDQCLFVCAYVELVSVGLVNWKDVSSVSDSRIE